MTSTISLGHEEYGPSSKAEWSPGAEDGRATRANGADSLIIGVPAASVQTLITVEGYEVMTSWHEARASGKDSRWVVSL